MTQINFETFKCDWCDHKQKHNKGSFNGKECKHHGQIICENCGRYISQKTKL